MVPTLRTRFAILAKFHCASLLLLHFSDVSSNVHSVESWKPTKANALSSPTKPNLDASTLHPFEFPLFLLHGLPLTHHNGAKADFETSDNATLSAKQNEYALFLPVETKSVETANNARHINTKGDHFATDLFKVETLSLITTQKTLDTQ